MTFRHPSVPKHNSSTYYNEFGGTSNSFLTRINYGVVPLASHYKVDGQGRDSYINNNNGGLFATYAPKKAAALGAFNEKKHNDLNESSLCRLPAKHIAYQSDGLGRD